MVGKWFYFILLFFIFTHFVACSTQQFNLTGFFLRDDEWFRIVCQINSSQMIGTIQIMAYSHGSSWLIKTQLISHVDQFQALFSTSDGGLDLVTKPPPTPLNDFTFRLAFKINGSYCSASNYDNWESNIPCNYTAVEINRIFIVATYTNLLGCEAFPECYRIPQM